MCVHRSVFVTDVPYFSYIHKLNIADSLRQEIITVEIYIYIYICEE